MFKSFQSALLRIIVLEETVRFIYLSKFLFVCYELLRVYLSPPPQGHYFFNYQSNRHPLIINNNTSIPSYSVLHYYCTYYDARIAVVKTKKPKSTSEL